jgi:hypothetical protein
MAGVRCNISNGLHAIVHILLEVCAVLVELRVQEQAV